MPATIKVVFDLTAGAWADLHDPAEMAPGQTKPNPFREDVELLGPENSELTVGRMPRGMKDSNNASVFFRVDRPDGSAVLIETALSCFVEAAKVMNSLDAAEKASTEALRGIADKPVPPQ